MSFLEPAAVREWTAVMAGDVVMDGSGSPWRVDQIAHEPGSRSGDASVMCWAQLTGSGGGSSGTHTLRVPDARAHVEMLAGPGYGLRAQGDRAIEWAIEEITRVLGGTLAST